MCSDLCVVVISNIYLLSYYDDAILYCGIKSCFRCDWHGGGLSLAGHGSRGYPGYELTNSVRVLPHPPIIRVSVGGSLIHPL